jgi:hypothetical protein
MAAAKGSAPQMGRRGRAHLNSGNNLLIFQKAGIIRLLIGGQPPPQRKSMKDQTSNIAQGQAAIAMYCITARYSLFVTSVICFITALPGGQSRPDASPKVKSIR